MNIEKNIIKIVGQLTNQLCDSVDLVFENFDNLPANTPAEATAVFAKINNAKENLQNTVFMKEIYPKVAIDELNENTSSESPCKAGANFMPKIKENIKMETEKIISEKVDNLIIHLCEYAELLLGDTDGLSEREPAETVTAIAELLKARKSFDSNALKQCLCNIISEEITY